jgi:hypothetical protein
MKIAVHQPQYLPWLGYFDKMAHCDAFVFLDSVQYKHREFQNRNRIRTPEGWMWLTVPVSTHGAREQLISDTKINNTFPWQRKHLHAIKNNYERSQYFSKHFPFFLDLYSKRWETLIELNVHIINYIAGQLKIKTEIMFESDIKTTTKASARILEICKKLNAETYVSGIGGKNYLKEDIFKQENIIVDYKDFKHPTYTQLYMRDKNNFEPYMSAIDLLFNHGEKSREILFSTL